jgi:hypothetical protein
MIKLKKKLNSKFSINYSETLLLFGNNDVGQLGIESNELTISSPLKFKYEKLEIKKISCSSNSTYIISSLFFLI